MMNTHVRDNLNYLKGDTTDIQIGTTGQKWGLGIAPTRQAHIYGAGQTVAGLTDAGNKGGTLYIQDSGGGGGNGGALVLGSTFGHWAALKALVTDGSGNSAGDLAFATRNSTADTALTERMRITGPGNVGIGTISPQGKLHVVGASGGMISLFAAAVAGSVVTVAVAGTVTRSAFFWLTDHNNTTLTGVGALNGTQVAVGGNTTYANTDTITVAVTAGGAITFQRTVGTNGTHDIRAWVQYE